LTNKDKRIKLKTMDIRDFTICFRKENSVEVTRYEDLFPEGIRCTKECYIWRGKEKSRKYMYFDQLLFLLPHLQDRETQSKLSTQRNEDEEEASNSQEKDKCYRAFPVRVCSFPSAQQA
jgi:hypothetical protein